MKNIGKVIGDIRRSKGFTQEEISVATGLTVSCISSLERGIRGISTPTLKKLCKCLKVPQDVMLLMCLEIPSIPAVLTAQIEAQKIFL